MSASLPRLTLVLRAETEAAVVAAFAYWGYHTGVGTATRLLLAVGAPALGFGFWGTVDFRQADRLAEPFRLAQELLISGLAAAALYATGQHVLGYSLAVLSVGYHALIYAQGDTLLKKTADARRSGTALAVRDSRQPAVRADHAERM